jgi:hypothetical protein
LTCRSLPLTAHPPTPTASPRQALQEKNRGLEETQREVAEALEAKSTAVGAIEEEKRALKCVLRALCYLGGGSDLLWGAWMGWGGSDARRLDPLTLRKHVRRTALSAAEARLAATEKGKRTGSLIALIGPSHAMCHRW